MRDALYALLGAILYLDGLIVFVFRVSTKHGSLKLIPRKLSEKKRTGVVIKPTFCDVGEGCLLVALYESGSLIILWDGRSHIDINLFTYVEDVNLVDVFVDSFLELIPAYTTILRDEQPRGSGRVVSYRRDLDDVQVPHWTSFN